MCGQFPHPTDRSCLIQQMASHPEFLRLRRLMGFVTSCCQTRCRISLRRLGGGRPSSLCFERVGWNLSSKRLISLMKQLKKDQRAKKLPMFWSTLHVEHAWTCMDRLQLNLQQVRLKPPNLNIFCVCSVRVDAWAAKTGVTGLDLSPSRTSQQRASTAEFGRALVLLRYACARRAKLGSEQLFCQSTNIAKYSTTSLLSWNAFTKVVLLSISSELSWALGFHR